MEEEEVAAVPEEEENTWPTEVLVPRAPLVMFLLRDGPFSDESTNLIVITIFYFIFKHFNNFSFF